jgi:hypothetical protein
MTGLGPVTHVFSFVPHSKVVRGRPSLAMTHDLHVALLADIG